MPFWFKLFQTLSALSTPPQAQVEGGSLDQLFNPDDSSSLSLDQSDSQSIRTLQILTSLPALTVGGVVGLLLLLVIGAWLYTRFYVITPTNEAFVLTGGLFGKIKKVILNGGCIVYPGFHELTRVPLREISIDVERTGKLAVRTQDYLRADMRVTFFVCITASEQSVLTAAARLAQAGKISPSDIKNAIEKRADDAIRAAAKTKTLAEIDSDKLGFAQEVLNLIEPDLKKVGLTLNNIAISEIEESDSYDTNNFFDAQGVRLRTETIQRSIQQKREVELVTQVTMQQRELDAEKRSLDIEQEKETARLAQQLQVEALRAQREREIEEAKAKELATTQRSKILQDKSVEEEEIRKKLSLQQSQINADIELEERSKQLKVVQATQQQEAQMAELARQQAIEAEGIRKQLAIQQNQIQANIDLEERNKLLKLAQINRQQESETAEILRKQAVEAAQLTSQLQITESERQVRIAQEETQVAITKKRQESFIAEAERAKAEASVLSASEIEKAERSQRLAVIAAEQEAQQRNIMERNVIELDAFRRKRQAEIAQQAAEVEAESIRILANAERDRAIAEAEGIRARLMAENTISTPNLTANVISEIWPELVKQLPEVLEALAPKPGVLGDARVYSFGNGNGSQDINKLLLSTSGLELITTLLDEGKLGSLLAQIKQLLHQSKDSVDPSTFEDPADLGTPASSGNPAIPSVTAASLDPGVER